MQCPPGLWQHEYASAQNQALVKIFGASNSARTLLLVTKETLSPKNFPPKDPSTMRREMKNMLHMSSKSMAQT